MGVISKAVEWALAIAKDDSHWYSQTSRWGPNYDCSSFVISAFEEAGVPVRSEGGAENTRNIRDVFLKYGFEDITASITKSNGAGTKKGDVLLNTLNHAALVYEDGGKIVHASHPDTGILTRGWYNHPWNYVLRYTQDNEENITLPRIMLNPGHGYYKNGTYDSGAVGNGYKEAELTREVADKVAAALSGYAQVDIWDKEKDMYNYNPTIKWEDYSFFLSIHFNASTDSASGCEVYHHPNRKDCKTDKLLLEKVVNAGGFASRGVMTATHAVTSRSDKCANGKTTSALLEVCFIDNADDMKKYQDNKDAVAKAIASALIEGLKLTYSGGGSYSANWTQKELPNNARALKCKTYERYWKITSQSTNNYKISCGDNASTHSSKLRVYKDDFLIIALGSYYGPVGTFVKIAFDNGKELLCIKGDEKDDRETNTEHPAHSYHTTGPGVVEKNQITENLLEVQADTKSSGWQQDFAKALDSYAGEGTYEASITGIWVSDTEPVWQEGSSSGDKETYFTDTNEVIPIAPKLFKPFEMFPPEEMAVYVNNKNITASAGVVSWTNSEAELSTIISIDVAKSDTRFTDIYTPKKGDILRLFLPEEVFCGIIISDDTGAKHVNKYTVADAGWYLNKTKDTYQFKNMQGDECIKKICKDFSIPIAYMDEGLEQVLVTSVYIDKAISEIFKEILGSSAERWNFDFIPSGIRFYKVGTFTANPQFRTSLNTALRSSVKYRGEETISSSIEDMKTAVKVISDTNVLGRVKSETGCNDFGFLQEVVQIDPEKEDAETVANNKLKELNRETESRSFPLQVQLSDYTRAGDVLPIENIRYVITSSAHTIEKGRHSINVEVERIDFV